MAYIEALSRPHASRAGFASRMGRMFAVYRQRRALARLDAAQLNDIGLTMQDVINETRRPFWDIA